MIDRPDQPPAWRCVPKTPSPFYSETLYLSFDPKPKHSSGLQLGRHLSWFSGTREESLEVGEAWTPRRGDSAGIAEGVRGRLELQPIIYGQAQKRCGTKDFICM
jgi:hypothetical protein